MHSHSFLLSTLLFVGWTTARPAAAITGNAVAPYTSSNVLGVTYVSNFIWPEYSIPQPPSVSGQFHVIVTQTNSTVTQFVVIDSLADYSGFSKITHTDQRALCTVKKSMAVGQHANCFYGTWQVWLSDASKSKVTVQSFVAYEGASVPGVTAYRARGASQIPVFQSEIPESKDYSVEEADATALYKEVGIGFSVVNVGNATVPP